MFFETDSVLDGKYVTPAMIFVHTTKQKIGHKGQPNQFKSHNNRIIRQQLSELLFILNISLDFTGDNCYWNSTYPILLLYYDQY